GQYYSYIAHLIVVYGWSTTFYCYDCCANEHNAHAVHRPCKPMCNGRRSRTPSPDMEGNQSSHLATTAPTLRPSPPRPLPARLRYRSVQRGQGGPITEQLRTSTRTPDRSPTPRHDRDLRICTLNCRTLASNASIAALEQSFEGIRYDVVCLQETKAPKTQELTLTNGARLILGPKVETKNIGGVGFLIHPRLVSSILSFSILSPRLAVLRIRLGRSFSLSLLSIFAPISAKAKQSLSRSKAPMDAILDSSGALITSRTGIEERVKEFYTDIFRSETPVPRCPTPPSDDPLPILPSEVRNCIARTKKDGA
ncbi:hypothetical protein PRIPAC_95724, partial [Pristionchus pacificus]|uniref:Endonuclease/exonuclease/phosphatase domain-containing protein n=1 Tax=Pristionchus pacificus TaxID=54126 RepID=A0A2A6CTX8_PRIPA